MKIKNKIDEQVHWTTYWEKGILNSCAYDSESGNYQGVISDFWKQKFTARSRLRLLDLCTGNGALISLLIGNNEKKTIEKAVGVDLANIKPEWIEGISEDLKEKIKFIPNTSISDLPLDNESFDVITSQFGIEYSNITKSIEEISRVLKPNGNFLAVIHNYDSIIVRNGKDEIDHINWLLRDKGLKDVSGKLLRFMAMLNNPHNIAKVTNDPVANSTRAQFNKIVEEAKSIASESNCPDIIFECLDTVMLSFNVAKESGIKKGKDIQKNLWEELSHNKKRLDNLLNAAQDEIKIKKLIECCVENKLTNQELITLHEKDQVIAWGLVLKKK